MTEITDDYMREHLTKTRAYAVVLLKAGEKYGEEGSDAIVWEHGRRNFSLRADGVMPIVCPVIDDTELCGVAIFDTSVERANEIMQDDPGVRAGVFTFEVHPVRGFPGSVLPGAPAF
jgi:hypothetical protein